MPDLTAVFTELRSIMAPYAAKLDAKKDEPSELYVDTFGELEDNAVGWEAETIGGRERDAQAGLRVVHGIGHKIDRQATGKTQLSRKSDRFDATGLVEAISVVGRYLSKHPASVLLLWTASQSFVRERERGIKIKDGLKRHAEIEIQFFGVAALRTVVLGGDGHTSSLKTSTEGSGSTHGK